MDFPIIGESKVSLSLRPSEVAKQIKDSELVDVLKEQIGERSDRNEILKTIEEFFVFSADFIRYKSVGVYPNHFTTSFDNDHYMLTRTTPLYIFQVDSFSENENFFERTIFKISFKSTFTTKSVMSLFLVPQSCDKK